VPKLDLNRLTPRQPSIELSTDQGARFAVGGRASTQASSSLNADVGARVSLRTRLQFDD
jgi:hypothetical protein